MPDKVLKLTNDLLSSSKAVGIGAHIGLAVTIWALIQRANSSLGVEAGWPRFAAEVAISISLPFVILLLRPLRWHFINRSLRSEIAWFRGRHAQILVGVGPGGAIMAGMVAKLMAEGGDEPEIEVIDRTYSLDEFSQLQVTIKAISVRLAKGEGGERRVGVVVVTPEIHSGGTIQQVCSQLQVCGIDAPVFAYLWSPHSVRRPRTGVDRFVIRTDQRGILPWPDAPASDQRQ